MKKKIIALALMIVIVFSFGACGSTNLSHKFDSLEELQKAAPNFYYFDFNVDGFNFMKSRAYGLKTGSTKEYYYYWITYYKNQKNDLSAFFVSRGDSGIIKSIEEYNKNKEYIDEYIIDDIKCFLFYELVTMPSYNCYIIDIVFDIDDCRYIIKYEVNYYRGQNVNLSTFVDYAMPIFEIAIENRYKII